MNKLEHLPEIKRILVFYYTQSGQGKEILDAMLRPVLEDNTFEVYFCRITPLPEYPFPWKSDEFFQVFPESVKGLPCEILPPQFNSDIRYDLVFIAYQPWYLSPSVPFHAFFQDRKIRSFLFDKNVVTVNACRNMWVMAQKDVSDYLKNIGVNHVGNIVLKDKNPNLLSVLSILRWMLKGRKKSSNWVPDAGISDQDIEGSVVFGNTIREWLLSGSKNDLQTRLLGLGAVEISPSIMMMETNAKRIFKIWARFILKKGDYGSVHRRKRLHLFKYYLITMIYLISPLAQLIFLLTWPFRIRKIKYMVQKAKHLS